MGRSIQGIGSDPFEGCEPSVVTYSLVVSFLCKDSKIDGQMCVFGMASEEGCHFDNTIYMCFSMHSAMLIEYQKLV
ncbi:hypothetical protein BRADI_5g09281v3 [Brachypodium distachyon]|uniref:Uncharacterized protein n=1 Tax=Brachypodium distachyon TaxID=15368 RepID=A0A0Q3KR48_BRADI|nr:hypothetical protein BRADI_5g09281v3 [Brachypodium distachyon]